MPAQCFWCVSPKRGAFEALVGSGQQTKTAVKALDLYPTKYQAAVRHVRNHIGRSEPTLPVSERAPMTAVETFRAAFGSDPMPHQVTYLSETRDTLVLKGRQVGISTAGGALAISTVRANPDVLVAIVSPSMKQSQEVTVKCRMGLVALNEKLVKDASGLLELDNRSRIVSLAGTARAVRGWSADLLIIDEAAFVEAATFAAARATTIATGGRTVVQSTPGNPVGAFYEMWLSDLPDWARIHVRSDEASTIDPADLARFQREMKPAEFAQEYLAEFATSGIAGHWFPVEEYDRRVDDRFTAIEAPEGLAFED